MSLRPGQAETLPGNKREWSELGQTEVCLSGWRVCFDRAHDSGFPHLSVVF